MKILMGVSLLLWLGVTPAFAVPPRLTEPALSQELQQLEDDAPPLLAYRARVAALVAHVDAYPPEVQGRIARLQCWAQPSERDEEFLRAVQFADRALTEVRGRKDRVAESGLLACRGYHQ